MKIGLFGGTFNPVHLGHLRVAEEVRESFYLNKIIFIPSGAHPLKKFDILDGIHRLKMLELAIAENSNFELSDFELKQKEPSYTVNTLAYFKKVYKTDILFFIMGADAFCELRLWYKYEELLKMIDFIVMSRHGFNNLETSDLIEHIESDSCFRIKNSDKKAFFVSVTPFPISSTQIRQMIRSGRSIRYLVPKEVLKYIEENKLYKT